MTFISVRCPYCHSDQIVKRGTTRRGTQRYLCQNTQRSAKKLMQHSGGSGYARRQIHPRGGGDDHGIPLA
jgi:transposase-like protein